MGQETQKTRYKIWLEPNGCLRTEFVYYWLLVQEEYNIAPLLIYYFIAQCHVYNRLPLRPLDTRLPIPFDPSRGRQLS